MKEKMPESKLLDLFFKPQSIAIIGLSRKAIDSPVSILTTIKDFGYQGDVYVVNPKLPPTGDLKIYPDLGSIKQPVDLAILSVARTRVLDVLRDCVANRIKAAIIITQGFADADEEGQKLQKEMVVLSAEHGIRILGPNTMGVMNAFHDFTSSFLEVSNEKIPIGLIAQSGLFMMGHHFLDNIAAGFGMAMDLGNASDINCSDVLAYFENEKDVSVIQIHMEALGNGKEFVQTAAKVSSKKPIIALKAGKSDAGEKAVLSHSGTAAGESEVYETAFKKAGVIAAKNPEELRLLSKAFLAYPPINGKRVGVMSFSGAACILSIDAIEGAELQLAKFSNKTTAALKEMFPPWMGVENPLDIWIGVSSGDFHTAYPRILEIILKDDNVDAVFCIYPSFTLPKHEDYNTSIHIRSMAKKFPQKPILCWSYGLDIAGFTKEIEKDGNVMVFPSLDDAALTVKKLSEYGKYKTDYDRPAEPKTFEVDNGRVKSILELNRQKSKNYLFEAGFEILEAYGNNTARWRFVHDQSELQQAAAELTFPLSLKISSPDIIHKSDMGGIRLNILNPDGLIDSYQKMLSDVKTRMPAAQISGMLVQEMVPAGKEIMIGAKKDSVFGHCIVIGSGGIYTEILKDFAFRLAPLSEEDASGMISELDYSPILRGVRGEPPCDLKSIVDVLLKISQLVVDFPEIAELDINPLMVYEQDALIIDARMILEN